MDQSTAAAEAGDQIRGQWVKRTGIMAPEETNLWIGFKQGLPDERTIGGVDYYMMLKMRVVGVTQDAYTIRANPDDDMHRKMHRKGIIDRCTGHIEITMWTEENGIEKPFKQYVLDCAPAPPPPKPKF